MIRSRSARWGLVPALALVLAGAVAPASAHPGGALTGGPHDTTHQQGDGPQAPVDPSAALSALDAATAGVVSSGPSAKVTKNLAVKGRGQRLVPDATTDVWAYNGYAYIGTFNSPCGTGEGFGTPALMQGVDGPGIPVFDVSNATKPKYRGNIPSVQGSRINDVKVARLGGHDILVHSNEACAGGPGGFEIYNVDVPTAPRHLAHVQVDDINPTLREAFGIVDVGVHNNYLFSRGGRSYNAIQAESEFGSFQVFDITDPAAAELVGWFGAEYVFDDTVDWATVSDVPTILAADAYLNSGFGNSRNRFLHDHYVTPDGSKAYLANWDAGLLLVDLGALVGSVASLVSVALDPVNGSLDGEVNSHSVWPTADGKTVVEGEEDFSAIVSNQPLSNFTFGDSPDNNIYGVGISPIAGDAFEANQFGNTVTVASDSVTVTGGPLIGNVYPAVEGSGSQPKLGDTTVTGEAVWIGQGCSSDPVLNPVTAGDIAVVRRGACTFGEKLRTAQGLGAAAIVISNNVRGDTPWGGLRIWDYSDPTSPVLASTFNTTCSADPFDSSCDPRGTYTVHNVIVEGHRAYVSWYSEGVLVLDISDPYHPTEVARYHESGPGFEARNGGIQDVWGIYKEPRRPFVYASDRNGGLYVLQQLGSGSGK
ncbi:MAG: PA domain-containing protein [Sporichthyaceae bacterium]